MSKERARRREERQREAAVLAAARAAEAERRERRDARVRAVTSRVPRRTRPQGILATRRRRQWRWLIAVLAVANATVWLFAPQWSARLGALVVTVLAAPVLHTLLFRRS